MILGAVLREAGLLILLLLPGEREFLYGSLPFGVTRMLGMSPPCGLLHCAIFPSVGFEGNVAEAAFSFLPNRVNCNSSLPVVVVEKNEL